MKHLAAYLLLTLGGNESPSAADVKSVLESVGIEADSDRLDTLISELKGKNVNDVCLVQPFSTSDTTLTYNSSSLLRVPRSLLPFLPAVLLVPLPEVLLPLVVPPRRPRRRRRRRRRRSPTRIWASVSSTKRSLSRDLHGYDASRISKMLRTGCSPVLTCLGRERIGHTWLDWVSLWMR
jgi:hypothetical protein